MYQGFLKCPLVNEAYGHQELFTQTYRTRVFPNFSSFLLQDHTHHLCDGRQAGCVYWGGAVMRSDEVSQRSTIVGTSNVCMLGFWHLGMWWHLPLIPGVRKKTAQRAQSQQTALSSYISHKFEGPQDHSYFKPAGYKFRGSPQPPTGSVIC